MDALNKTDMEQLERNAESACALLKAMSNERRLLILCHLATGESSVGDLERRVGLSQSALSQHLAVLREKKLVETRREAQTIYYRLASREAEAIMATLWDLYCGTGAAHEEAKLPA
jgi:DNA-binding transcriptional ArsR family regulator